MYQNNLGNYTNILCSFKQNLRKFLLNLFVFNIDKVLFFNFTQHKNQAFEI